MNYRKLLLEESISKELSLQGLEDYIIENGYMPAPFLKDYLLLIANECEYISAYALSRLLMMPSDKIDVCRNKLVELTNKGFLNRENICSQDGRTKVVYYITKLGKEQLEGSIGVEICDDKRKTKRKIWSSLHDYANGLAFMGIIASGKGFTWEREKVINFNNNWSLTAAETNKKYSHRIDAVIGCKGKTIYYEQDMGTETIGVLNDKIYDYRVVEAFDNSEFDTNMLVIGFHKAVKMDYKAGICPIETLNEYKCIILHQEEFKSLNELYSHIKSVFENKQSKKPELRKLYTTTFIKLVQMIRDINTGRNLSLSEFSSMLDDEKVIDLLYELEYRNKLYEFAIKRKTSLKDYMFKQGCSTNMNISFYMLASRGLSCYCIPTILISKLIDCMTIIDWTDTYKKVFDGIHYYPQPSYVRKHVIPDYRNITFFNCVHTDLDHVVTFEDIEYDIGSILRILLISQLVRSCDEEANICICMIVDEKATAVEFATKNKIYYDNEILHFKGVSYCYIERHNLSKSEKLFTVNSNGDIVHMKKRCKGFFS